jgi:hypothetical protein
MVSAPALAGSWLRRHFLPLIFLIFNTSAGL